MRSPVFELAGVISLPSSHPSHLIFFILLLMSVSHFGIANLDQAEIYCDTMKTYSCLLCSLGMLAAVTQADASTLYGSTAAGGPGELWILNPANGSPVQDVGPLNDALGANYAVTGLAFDPLNGVLYGSTASKSGQSLLTINPASGLVTVVGPLNSGGGGTMADLAFDASGSLYGISASGGANLYSINLATGQATKVGTSGQGFTAGGGLGISPTGVFYCVPEGNNFGTINPTTGVYTFIGTSATPGGANTSYASLAFDGSTLYGMNLGSPTHLVTFDLATGAITDLGASVPSIDGIAFSTIPEPSTLALLLGAGMTALLVCKRRRASGSNPSRLEAKA
jgi:hypothetical protein